MTTLAVAIIQRSNQIPYRFGIYSPLLSPHFQKVYKVSILGAKSFSLLYMSEDLQTVAFHQ